jgi:hypothetical protein
MPQSGARGETKQKMTEFSRQLTKRFAACMSRKALGNY